MNLEHVAELVPDLLAQCEHCTKLRAQLEGFKQQAVEVSREKGCTNALVRQLSFECHMCDGFGYVLTEKAKALIFLLNKFEERRERPVEPEPLDDEFQ